GSAAPTAAPAVPAATSSAFDALYAEAQALYKDGKYAEALEAYLKARAIDPAPEALYGVARCYHQMAKPPEAVAAYEEFLRVAPTHSGAPKARGYLVEVLVGIAVKDLTVSKYADARATYEKALGVWAVADPTVKDATSGALLAGRGEAMAYL